MRFSRRVMRRDMRHSSIADVPHLLAGVIHSCQISGHCKRRLQSFCLPHRMPKLVLRLLEPVFVAEMGQPLGKTLGVSEFPDRDIVNRAAMVVADGL